jgi:hypothetical protein
MLSKRYEYNNKSIRKLNSTQLAAKKRIENKKENHKLNLENMSLVDYISKNSIMGGGGGYLIL